MWSAMGKSLEILRHGQDLNPGHKEKAVRYTHSPTELS